MTPVIGRWGTVDPLADSYDDISPYNYALSNPIIYIDPDGRSIDKPEYLASTFVDGAGKIIKHIDDGDPNIYFVENTRKWDGSKNGLQIIGLESESNEYVVGNHILGEDLFTSFEKPKGFTWTVRIDQKINQLEVSPLLVGIAKGAAQYFVYISRGSKGVRYVGITNNFARRAAEHLRTKGIDIERFLEGLSKSDAKAVEQVLIELHRLEKTGGTLLNKINSISAKNPVYQESIRRGKEILEKAVKESL